jgi:hypothetical protein
MPDQQHHTNKVEYSHENRCHIQELEIELAHFLIAERDRRHCKVKQSPYFIHKQHIKTHMFV